MVQGQDPSRVENKLDVCIQRKIQHSNIKIFNHSKEITLHFYYLSHEVKYVNPTTFFFALNSNILLVFNIRQGFK